MKKVILACMTAVWGLSLSAQQTAEILIMSENMGEEQVSVSRPIMLGATAGINMTTYSGDRNPKMGMGGQLGINCDIPINDYFSIMPELIFAYKSVGVDLSWDNNNELMTMESTDKLVYMNVPINVKLSADFGPGRPFVAVGPMISVGLFGENRVKVFKKLVDLYETKAGEFKRLLLFQADSNTGFLEYREEPFYSNIDFSVNLKAGYDFDFGLAISAGLQWGFLNMYKMNDEREALYKKSGLDTSQGSMTFYVVLGYNF